MLYSNTSILKVITTYVNCKWSGSLPRAPPLSLLFPGNLKAPKEHQDMEMKGLIFQLLLLRSPGHPTANQLLNHLSFCFWRLPLGALCLTSWMGDLRSLSNENKWLHPAGMLIVGESLGVIWPGVWAYFWMFSKGLYPDSSWIHKRNPRLPIKQLANDFKSHFSKEYIEMDKQHMKTCWTLLVIQEMQIKITMKCHFISTSMATI